MNPSIPNGHYAVTFTNGVTRFFKVTTPVKGNWKGMTFVKIQAGDDYYPVKDAAKRRVVLDQIALDVKAASALYGQQIGACGVCGRTLTDETSREIGIGPVCITRF